MHPEKGEQGFRWRGGDPTRVEALSDMVFAFALTLLVVSNAPPTSFSELASQLWGFPGFAAAFSILLLIWHSHYIFFRRYALTDALTTVLNAGLLFLILFFVYPLKFFATMLSEFLRNAAGGNLSAPMSLTDARFALVILAGAYAAVFAMFAALYGHARRNADLLDLDAGERSQSRFSHWVQLVHVFVGATVTIVAMFAPNAWAPLAGFLFFLIGPLIVLVSVVVPVAPTLSPDNVRP